MSGAHPRRGGRRSGQPNRRRWLLSGLVLLVAAVAVALGVRGDLDGEFVELPDRGEAAGALLADGTPVLVVHHDDGDVSVLDARAPAGSDGVVDLVGWCERPSGPRLMTRTGGLGWAPDGRPETLVPIGLDATAVERDHLVGYEVDAVPSRAVARVGDRLAPARDRGPEVVERAVSCPRGALAEVPPLPGEPAALSQLRAQPADGRYAVVAALQRVGQGRARLCDLPDADRFADDDLPRLADPLTEQEGRVLPLCDDGDLPLDLDVGWPPPPDEDWALAYAGEMSVVLRDGQVRELMISPAARFLSAPVGGEFVVTGWLVADDDRTDSRTHRLAQSGEHRPPDLRLRDTRLVDAPGGYELASNPTVGLYLADDADIVDPDGRPLTPDQAAAAVEELADVRYQAVVDRVEGTVVALHPVGDDPVVRRR